jgi:flagellin-like protein
MSQKKLSMNKRRGVSNIIGSLVVLAVVASIGSVILFQGLNQINAFNYDLTFFDETKNQELREDIIFQHVRFINGTTNVELYLSNIGTVESTITSVVMIHNPSQELVLNWVAPSNSTIQLDSSKMLNFTATNLPGGVSDWNDTDLDDEYKISITTSKGNFFPSGGKVVKPWNT